MTREEKIKYLTQRLNLLKARDKDNLGVQRKIEREIRNLSK